jgi:hypothetical protein
MVKYYSSREAVVVLLMKKGWVRREIVMVGLLQIRYSE